jgi:hypothetical protein
MVRELKPPPKGIQALEELEKITDDEVEKVEKQREKDFKKEMDTAFYFSVVFDTREDRDKWLKDRKLKLIEDTFIKASDLNL